MASNSLRSLKVVTLKEFNLFLQNEGHSQVLPSLHNFCRMICPVSVRAHLKMTWKKSHLKPPIVSDRSSLASVNETFPTWIRIYDKLLSYDELTIGESHSQTFQWWTSDLAIAEICSSQIPYKVGSSLHILEDTRTILSKRNNHLVLRQVSSSYTLVHTFWYTKPS